MCKDSAPAIGLMEAESSCRLFIRGGDLLIVDVFSSRRSGASAVQPVDTIKTERLLLRPVVADDLHPLADLGADPEVMRYIGSGEPQSREEARGVREPSDCWTRRPADRPGPAGLVGWRVVTLKATGEWVGLAHTRPSLGAARRGDWDRVGRRAGIPPGASPLGAGIRHGSRAGPWSAMRLRTSAYRNWWPSPTPATRLPAGCSRRPACCFARPMRSTAARFGSSRSQPSSIGGGRAAERFD